ncbi:MAG: ATP-dependent zinc metalloprotease FtsH [Patescibacteria group bacterium]
MFKNLSKNLISFLIILLILVGLFGMTSEEGGLFETPDRISTRQLVERVNNEEVEEITLTGNEVEILFTDDEKAMTRKEDNISFLEFLERWGAEEEEIKNLTVNYQEEADWGWLTTLLIVALPIVFILIFFQLILKQAKGGASSALDFSKAKARLFGEGGMPKKDVDFEDVAGLEEAKEELKEIVQFLKDPKRFDKVGAKIPKGVLLTGPPGTGKTLLARAVSGEADVPFFEVSGSEFIELFVGVGSGRVRDLFKKAKAKQPCIVYIDELDAIGRKRGAGVGGGNDEREQTLNQILVELDGFAQDTKVVVLASTNRPDVLDPALLRPGRFDRKVILDSPDLKARKKILEIHTREKPLADNVKLQEVAERTPGFSGADLENLANEAAILTARKEKEEITQTELLESIEKVMLGPERKSHILTDKEKEISAYHEAGHALISSLLAETQEVRKVSIISRGQAAGYTLKMPMEEKKMKNKSEFLAEISVLLGGYTAEKIIYNETTTGASNDLEKASKYARKLVKKYGMSSLGPISYGGEKEHVFLGEEISEEKNYSEEVAAKIDKEISKIIKKAEEKSLDLLKENKDKLEELAKILIEKETIEKEEFEKIVNGKNKEG